MVGKVEWQGPVTRFLVALIVVSFALALGKNTPIFPFLYQYVPTFNMFQAPARFSLWAVFGLALLAGKGAHDWRRAGLRGRGWVKRGIAAAVAVVLASGAGLVLLGDVKLAFIQATALAGLLGIAAGFLALFAPQDERVTRLVAGSSGRSGDSRPAGCELGAKSGCEA